MKPSVVVVLGVVISSAMLVALYASSRGGTLPVSPELSRPHPFGESVERALATLDEPVLPAMPTSPHDEVFRLVHVTPETAYAFYLTCIEVNCYLAAKQASRTDGGRNASAGLKVSTRMVALDAAASDAWRRTIGWTGFWQSRLVHHSRYRVTRDVVNRPVDAATSVLLSDYREAIWVLQGWRGHSYNLWQADDTNSCSLGSLFDLLVYRLALTVGFDRPISTVDFASDALDDREIDLPDRACEADPVHLEPMHNGAPPPIMVMTRPVEVVVRGDAVPDLQVPSQAEAERLWLPRPVDDDGCSYIIDSAVAPKPGHPAGRSIWSISDAPRAAELSTGCSALR
jgi:hypothetical protein